MSQRDFIPLGRPSVTQAELDAVAEVIRSGWWTTGPAVTRFEQQLAAFIGHDTPVHALGLNSCTSALHLSLMALGIGPGDEVIVPTWTFIATSHVVEWLGATPVLCDVDEGTLNIDVAAAAKLITPKTKAIMPVHIAGWPCDMDAVAELAKAHDLFVVEDAAHAIGTYYNGTHVGTRSDAACFSFYATKNLAMGEGGAVVSHSAELVERMRGLSYFGISKASVMERYGKNGSWRYDVEGLGYKCNLDSMHAALGLVQLERLEAMNHRRREIAAAYRAGLSPKLRFLNDQDPKHTHAYHLFILRVPKDVMDRDEFIAKLREKDVGTSVHFIPLHLHPHFAKLYKPQDLPVASRCFEEVVSLPMYPDLSDNDVTYVIDTVNDLVGKQ